jgi:hypothetical protein
VLAALRILSIRGCSPQASDAAADILAALRPMPTKEEWEAEELHQYGLIAVDSKGNATQLEKVTYDVATAYLPKDVQQACPPQHVHAHVHAHVHVLL